MIKKLLFILFFIPLFAIGQYNFFASYPSCYLCYLHEYTQQYNTGANHDIFFNSTGTYMYILGGAVSTTIYQYSLSPAWNIRSASYYSSYGVGNEETDPYGMFFKSDGTKLYIVGTGSDNIYQYTLSTPWVISTATYDSKYFYIGGSDNIPTALFFNSDGSKVFFLGQQNKTVYVLSLLTEWDISTANLEAEVYDFSSDEIYPHGLFFSSDGLSMYVEGINQDKIFRYSLSTAWTLPDPWNEATVTPVDNFAITGDQAQGMFFKPDWTKVYTVGGASVNVYYFNEPGIPETIDLTTDLYAVWEMDETTGTTAYDAHGSSNLTIGSGIDINQPGKLGTSFYYSDGINDVLTKTSFYALSGSTSFSISMWVKPVANERNHFVSIRDGTSYYPGFYASAQPSSTDPLSPPVAVMSDGTYSVYCDEASTLINDSEWHFLVITYNGSTETMQFYIDNVLEDTAVATGTLGTLSSTLYIGNGSGYATHRYKGWIDQVAFWEEVLNVDAISALYNSGNGKAYSTW